MTDVTPTAGYDVTPSGAGVHVEGLSADEAEQALELFAAARRLQYEHGVSAARNLLRTVVESGLELTPPASVEQARRLANLRQELLTTPVFTYETLAQVRGDRHASSTRTWVSRARGRQQLFTVDVDGRTIIPAFQLTDTGKTRPELAPVLAELLEADIDGWTVWPWLTRPTPLLSGATPTDVVEKDPDRVRRAAHRFASSDRSAA